MYPQLEKFDKLIKNVIRAQRLIDAQDEMGEEIAETLMEEGLTDIFFDQKEVKGGNSSHD